MNDLGADEHDLRDMQELADGHDAVLNDLMERHAEKVFRYLLRHLNETEASEIAEETFVRVYQHRDDFKNTRKFSTWLYTIATNLMRDRLRWRRRHPEVSLEAEDNEHRSLGDKVAAPSRTPSEETIRSETCEQVRAAVQSLSEELRTPFVLCEYEGLAHAEIAAVLSCSIKAVEMKIYRARKELRELLQPLVAEIAPPRVPSIALNDHTLCSEPFRVTLPG